MFDSVFFIYIFLRNNVLSELQTLRQNTNIVMRNNVKHVTLHGDEICNTLMFLFACVSNNECTIIYLVSLGNINMCIRCYSHMQIKTFVLLQI
jgi:hypothetical protein